MKKIFICAAAALTLFVGSCTKDNGGLAVNSWSISGKTINATSVVASPTGAYISASDGAGSSLDCAFKALPTANGDFSVSDEALTVNDVAVRCVLSGNIIYNSFPQAAHVIVRVSGAGKYTVIMNDVKLVNANKATDTVVVSSNFVQP